MKYMLLMALLLMSCGNDKDVREGFDLNESEIKIIPDERGCIYGPEEQIELEFIGKTAENDRFLVDFWVTGKAERFRYGGKMSKECSEDFKRKEKVAATLQRIKTGACNRLVIFPKGYGPGCFNL